MGQHIDRDLIASALAQARDTHALVLERGALAAVDRVFGEAFGERAARVVADERTFAVAGRAVDAGLGGLGRTVRDPVIFPAAPTLHADFRHVLALQEALARDDAIPIAVGSGTINDLTKLASHRAGLPYMVVATAASMDGYAAFGAAITRDGFKQTMACPAPRAIVADLDILAAAPPAMTASGYADLVGKVTAGADWLIADALAVEPILPEIWTMVQEPLLDAISGPAGLPAGDPDAVERLFLGLILTGLAMQAAGSSRPASGSEHQFSHLWEMRHLSVDGAEISHGVKVGLGSIAMTGLYEELLRQPLADLDIAAACARWPSWPELEQAIRRHHPDPLVEERALAESRAKYITGPGVAQRLELLRERWPALRERLAAQLLPSTELRALLHAAGCPIAPEGIGLTWPQVRESYEAARQIRRRYTVLDLAAESGVLDRCVAALFQPGGYWRRAWPSAS